MPYIQTTTNVAIPGDKEKVIKERMGKAIALIPGKSETWLMLSFHGDTAMYFQGSDKPCAVCCVKLYGKGTQAAYANLTGALTDILREELGLEPDRVYVTYEEIGTWGWNGGNL